MESCFLRWFDGSFVYVSRMDMWNVTVWTMGASAGCVYISKSLQQSEGGFFVWCGGRGAATKLWREG